jgi:large subunit ribosomal protein L29
MKASEFHEMKTEELNIKLGELKEKLFRLRFSHATGQLANPQEMSVCKKDIARVKTILRAREIKALLAPAPDKPDKKAPQKKAGAVNKEAAGKAASADKEEPASKPAAKKPAAAKKETAGKAVSSDKEEPASKPAAKKPAAAKKETPAAAEKEEAGE